MMVKKKKMSAAGQAGLYYSRLQLFLICGFLRFVFTEIRLIKSELSRAT
jgi:hypothetical protein